MRKSTSIFGHSIGRKICSSMMAIAMVTTMVIAPTSKARANINEEDNDIAKENVTLSNPDIKKVSYQASGQIVTYDCVYFGSYPQAEVVASVEDETTLSCIIKGDNDYIVDSSVYNQLVNATGWDSNGDITLSNGSKYRRIKKGDATYSYYDEWGDGQGSEYYYNWKDETTYHYFIYQPIKWRVLSADGSTAFLLSDVALDDRRYNEEYAYITWEKSTIRSFLNSYGSSYNSYGNSYTTKGFLSTAFTQSEQNAIKETLVVNDNNKNFGTAGGDDTTDKIFLLSEEEVYGKESLNYGFANKGCDEAKRTKSSTYAKAMGCWSSSSSGYAGNCYWWLRSPGLNDDYATYVDYYGYVNYIGYDVNYNNYVVRPALKLNLSSYNPTYAGKVSSKQPIDSYITINTTQNSYSYTGKDIKPEIIISGTSGELSSDEYVVNKIEYTDNINVGTANVTASITIEGAEITKSFYFTIEPATLSDSNITLLQGSYAYTGQEIKPEVKVVGDDGFVYDTSNYDVTYIDNINQGMGTVIVTGKNNLTGTVRKYFTITSQSVQITIADSNVTLEGTSFSYTGQEIKPAVTVKDNSGNVVAASNYDVVYLNNTEIGKAFVTVTMKGNYSGSFVKQFDITEQELSDVNVSSSLTKVDYDGKAHKSKITVVDKNGNVVGDDSYNVSYKNNTNAGTASVTVTMKGNYSGTIVKQFSILPISVDEENVELSAYSFSYKGTAIKPAVTVMDNDGTAIPSSNYAVAYKNNINAGTATVTVAMKGNYTGTIIKKFRINQATNAITVPKTAYTKVASATTVQSINLGAKAKGGTITYTSSDKKVTVSKIGKVTIPKNYAGKTTITITAKNNNYKAVTKKVTITVNPAKEKIVALSNAAAGKLTVKWTKFAYANGYELQYAIRSNFQGAKRITVTNASTISKVIGGLKKGTTYFVRVRAYKNVGGTKLYGAMSDVKRLKVSR